MSDRKNAFPGLAQSPSEIRESLAAHLQNGTPCEVFYDFNDDCSSEENLVVSIHSDFVVLARIFQSSWINGFKAVRLPNVTRVFQIADRDFILRALDANEITVPSEPPVACSTFLEFLRIVCDKFGVITTNDAPSSEYGSAAGIILDVSPDALALRSMSTKGFWEEPTHIIKLKHITHVLFGSKYEHTLNRIANLPDA